MDQIVIEVDEPGARLTAVQQFPGAEWREAPCQIETRANQERYRLTYTILAEGSIDLHRLFSPPRRRYVDNPPGYKALTIRPPWYESAFTTPRAARAPRSATYKSLRQRPDGFKGCFAAHPRDSHAESIYKASERKTAAFEGLFSPARRYRTSSEPTYRALTERPENYQGCFTPHNPEPGDKIPSYKAMAIRPDVNRLPGRRRRCSCRTTGRMMAEGEGIAFSRFIYGQLPCGAAIAA